MSQATTAAQRFIAQVAPVKDGDAASDGLQRVMASFITRQQQTAFFRLTGLLGHVSFLKAASKVTTSSHTSAFLSSCLCGSCSQMCFTVHVSVTIKWSVSNCPTRNKAAQIKLKESDRQKTKTEICTNDTFSFPGNLQIKQTWRMFLHSCLRDITGLD